MIPPPSGLVFLRASHGDIHLGGDDFDEALTTLGDERLREKHSAALPTAAIHASLVATPEAIDARDWDQLRNTLDTLGDLFFYLED